MEFESFDPPSLKNFGKVPAVARLREYFVSKIALPVSISLTIPRNAAIERQIVRTSRDDDRNPDIFKRVK